MHIIWVVPVRMRHELGGVEDMLSETDDQTQHGDHQYGTSVDEPNDDVECKILAPGLAYVLPPHPAKAFQEGDGIHQVSIQNDKTHRRLANISLIAFVVSPSFSPVSLGTCSPLSAVQNIFQEGAYDSVP